MGLPTSLVRRHNHLRALSALGLPLEKPSFPAILQCPRCGQHALQLFDDTVTDGIWLNCQGCSAHGDIIIFAAELWKLSLPDTLSKFSDMGLIAGSDADRVVGEYDRYFKRKTAVENFLYDAEAQVWNHGDDIIACRLRELGIRHETEDCHGLVGVAHHDQITKICSELGRPKPPRLRDGGPSIVFPFYDLPGRPTGVLLLQYNSAYESKQHYVPVSGSKKRRPEAGYYLLKTAWLSKHPSLKNTQFVVDDVLWALKAQCESLKLGQGWLPVSAAYTGPEAESYGTSWQSFNPATRIFHGHSPTPELVSRACNAKGYIAITHINRATLSTQIKAMRKAAQTWQQCLKTTLSDANEMTAEAFAKRLTIPPDKLNLFLSKIEHSFSRGFKDRIMMVANAPIDAPLTVQRRWFIIDRENGWWNQTNRQVSNFRVVIEKVLHADNGEKIYEGSVYMDGNKYPFIELARRIVRIGLLTYASSLLAQNGKLGIFDDVWDKKAHLIAMQLHSPELITISTTYGWDEKACVFRFSNYEIDNSGAVRKTYPWPDRPKNKDFQEPTPIAPLSLRRLITPDHENSFIWAVTAAVISNLVAPIARKDCVSTALPANGFELATKIGAALGCDIERTNAFQRHVAGKFLSAATDNAVWPVVCCGTFNDEVFGHTTPRFFNCPLLLRMTKPSTAIALGYGWQRIVPQNYRHDEDVSVLRDVLPAYMQRILQRRMSVFGTTGNLNDLIIGDLHDWLSETYGTAFNLPHTKSLVWYENRAHEALMLELADAILAGKIAVLPQPRTSKQASNYVLKKKDHWWLNRRAIDSYFYSAKCVTPNWSAIVALLKREGIYTGDEVIHNMTGLNVDASWCEKFYSATEEVPQKDII